jgi:integrase
LERRDDRPGAYSAASKDQRLRTCKTAFNVAVEWELVTKNPFARVKAPKPDARPWHHLTVDEYARLLAAAPDLRRKVIYALAYTAGLRFGEVFNITWADIDVDAGQVRIAHRPATAALPPFVVKDHEKRIISLPQHTLGRIEDLGTYRNAVDDESPFLAIEAKRLARVCTKWKTYRAAGRPWKNQDMTNNINRDLNRHLGRAGVVVPETEAFSFHTLRKSCIQNWADARLPMHVVRELAGHESITTTQRYYLRTSRSDLDRAAAISQELIAGALLEQAK